MNAKFENEVFEDELNDGIPVQTAAMNASSSAKGATLTRHEESMEAETIVFDKETGEVFEEPTAKKGAQVRTKRTEAQMIASLGGSALKEATYVAERVAKLEDKITELMGAIGQKAREHILNDYPHLSRY